VPPVSNLPSGSERERKYTGVRADTSIEPSIKAAYYQVFLKKLSTFSPPFPPTRSFEGFTLSFHAASVFSFVLTAVPRDLSCLFAFPLPRPSLQIVRVIHRCFSASW
jgi:hypothetical protein